MALRTAVIGLGYMGGNHLRTIFDMNDYELAAVVDVDAEKAARVAEKYNCNHYSSVADMLKNETIDCASITVPTLYHRETVLALIGKSVPCLLEKPIAQNTAEAKKIIEAARKGDATLLVGHIERFNPAIGAVKELVGKDRLNHIFLATAERVGPLPTRPQEVGVVTDLAVHDIDTMRFILGSEIGSVYGKVRKVSSKNVEDMGEAMLAFNSGINAHLRVNWLTPTKIRKLKIFGESGMVEADYISQDVFVYENEPMRNDVDFSRFAFGVSEGEVRKLRVNKKEPLKAELEHFARCVRDGEKPLVSMEDAYNNIVVAEAIKSSSNADRVIKLGDGDYRI